MTHTPLFYDLFQYVMVGALVAGCAVYCVLSLAPNAIKEPLRDVLRRLPLPERFLAKLNQSPTESACGSSCGGCSTAAATRTQQVHWHPRKR